jgi:hypothetical protein
VFTLSGGGGRHGDGEVGVADLDGGGDEQWGLPLASVAHGDQSICWICGGTMWAR